MGFCLCLFRSNKGVDDESSEKENEPDELDRDDRVVKEDDREGDRQDLARHRCRDERQRTKARHQRKDK